MKLEQSILKHLIYSEDYFRKVLPFLKTEYFSDRTEKTLYDEIVKAMRTPELRETFAQQGVGALTESPSQFTAFIKADRERMMRVARQVEITLD